MVRRAMLIGLALLFVPHSAYSERSRAVAQWGTYGAHLFMTENERAQWDALESDVEVARFIEEFWARRDPTPGTPENEFRKEIESRIAVADEQFGRRKGRPADRGEAFILFGPPDEIRYGVPRGPRGGSMFQNWEHGASWQDQGAAGAGFASPLRASGWELWIYRGERASRMGFEDDFVIFFMDGRFMSTQYHVLRIATRAVVRDAVRLSDATASSPEPQP